jgi:hypothetical protein
MFVLAASEVLRYGLGYVGLTERAKRWKPKRQELEFHKHYGSSSAVDPPDLHTFKSRARIRQETFNHRLRCFSILSHTFTHGWDKHGSAFTEVVVIVQYQMDNGSPIFTV